MNRFWVQVTPADKEQVENMLRIFEALESLESIIDGLADMLHFRSKIDHWEVSG